MYHVVFQIVIYIRSIKTNNLDSIMIVQGHYISITSMLISGYSF